MLTKLKHLVNVSGISGREAAIAAKISEYMTPLCDKVYTDAMGSLIAYKKGTGEKRRKIMLVAHMDEIGFVVTHIEKNGMLRLAPIGGIHFSASAFSEVVFENGQRGVLVPETGVKPNDWTYDKMVVDIGAKDARDAEKRVAIGDFFSVAPNVIKLSARRIAGRPIDDRIGSRSQRRFRMILARTTCISCSRCRKRLACAVQALQQSRFVPIIASTLM